MHKDKISKVKTEVKRLLARIKELEDECATGSTYYFSPKQTGAVRRASMDLTRALADLRRYS